MWSREKEQNALNSFKAGNPGGKENNVIHTASQGYDIEAGASKTETASHAHENRMPSLIRVGKELQVVL